MAFNTRIVWPLISEVRQRLSQDQQGTFEPEEMEGLRQLVGELMKLPVKLAATTLAAWVLAALARLSWAQMAPDFYPWSPETSYSLSAFLITLDKVRHGAHLKDSDKVFCVI